MTEDKLHCYIKSVKHDTKEVTDWLRPVLVVGLQIAGVILLTGIVLYLVAVVSNSIIDTVTPIVLAGLSFITQEGVYLVVMVGIDLCILYGVKKAMEGRDEPLKELIGQIVTSLFGILFWFFFNACLLYLGKGSYDPTRFYGWSYMIWESAINAVIIVVGILLVRAYVRCEKIDEPISGAVVEGGGE